MRSMSPCYYSKEILNVIDEAIYEGISSFSDLSDADTDHLLANCIDALGEDSYSLILGDDLSSMMQKFKKSIISRSKDDALTLSEFMRKEAITYINDDMDAIFEERLSISNSWRMTA